MYPLANWKNLRQGYRFGVKTTYSNFHLGTDKIVPVGTPVYAPFDGEARVSVGDEGGNTVTFYPTGINIVIRFLHNSEMYGGTFKKCQIIAKTGNTGLSSAPHSHIDISKNKLDIHNTSNFINPDTFNWEQQGDTNMSVKTELDKPGLGKAKAMAFLNYEDNGEDINDYLNQNYGGKPLGDQSMMAFIDYMWKHPNRAKAMAEYRSQKNTIAQLNAQVADLKKQLANAGNVDKASIRDHASKIIDLAK